MQQSYEAPELEIVGFDTEYIIRTSNETEMNDDF